MNCEMLIFVVILSIIAAEAKTDMEKGRVVGVHTYSDINVQKDMPITSKIKLGKHISKKSADFENQENKPDWSYSLFPNEVQAHVMQFKLNMSECLKEVEAKESKNVQRLSPNKDSPVHGDCLIACVLKRNEIILHGKINKENLLSLVNKFFAKDTQLMKKLEKQLDRCINSSIRINDECLMAAQLNHCTNDIMANNKHKIVINY